MQAYYNIHNLVEGVQRCVYLKASLSSHSILHIIYSFAVFCKGRNFINLRVNPLEQIALLTIHCPAAAWAAFQDDTLPCYFIRIHFVCINASPGQTLIFRQLIACPNNVSFTQYNNSQCICRSREWLAIVQWHTLTPSWSLAQAGRIFARLGSAIVFNVKIKMLLYRMCVWSK